MAIRHIDRIALDGSSVTLVFGRTEIPCVRASYGDKIDTEKLRFMGSQKVDAITLGTYDTEEATVEIEEVVYRTMLQPALRRDGYGNEAFPLTVVYGSPDLGYESDLLEGARIVGVTTSPENSAKAITKEIKIVFTQLYEGNDRITINQRDLTAVSPVSRL